MTALVNQSTLFCIVAQCLNHCWKKLIALSDTISFKSCLDVIRNIILVFTWRNTSVKLVKLTCVGWGNFTWWSCGWSHTAWFHICVNFFSVFSVFSKCKRFLNEDLHKIYDPNISQQNRDAEEAQIWNRPQHIQTGSAMCYLSNRGENSFLNKDSARSLLRTSEGTT